MICRRGDIDKRDIGAIRILDTTTEFEISERVAGSFAVKIRRPDKEDNIRIEPLAAPSGQAPSEKRSHSPWSEASDTDHSARQSGNSRDATGPKQPGKHYGESGSKFGGELGFGKKKKHRNKSSHAGQPPPANAPPAKATLGKKARKNHRG
jgi:ATP-dependent RNA helicase DeaD